MISKDSKDKNNRRKMNNVITLNPCQSMIRQENSLWSIMLVNNIKIIIVLRTKTLKIKTPPIIILPLH